MSKNKSVNEQRTKDALTFYYKKAQELGIVTQILQQGGFQRGAIQTSISRGRLSQRMIDSFVQVVGAQENYLTGQDPLPQSTETDIDLEEIMTDEQAKTLLDLIMQTQDAGNTLKKKTAIGTIKNILNQF